MTGHPTRGVIMQKWLLPGPFGDRFCMINGAAAARTAGIPTAAAA